MTGNKDLMKPSNP